MVGVHQVSTCLELRARLGLSKYSLRLEDTTVLLQKPGTGLHPQFNHYYHPGVQPKNQSTKSKLFVGMGSLRSLSSLSWGSPDRNCSRRTNPEDLDLRKGAPRCPATSPGATAQVSEQVLGRPGLPRAGDRLPCDSHTVRLPPRLPPSMTGTSQAQQLGPFHSPGVSTY